jgi:hypothetical protein
MGRGRRGSSYSSGSGSHSHSHETPLRYLSRKEFTRSSNGWHSSNIHANDASQAHDNQLICRNPPWRCAGRAACTASGCPTQPANPLRSGGFKSPLSCLNGLWIMAPMVVVIGGKLVARPPTLPLSFAWRDACGGGVAKQCMQRRLPLFHEMASGRLRALFIACG